MVWVVGVEWPDTNPRTLIPAELTERVFLVSYFIWKERILFCLVIELSLVYRFSFVKGIKLFSACVNKVILLLWFLIFLFFTLLIYKFKVHISENLLSHSLVFCKPIYSTYKNTCQSFTYNSPILSEILTLLCDNWWELRII